MTTPIAVNQILQVLIPVENLEQCAENLFHARVAAVGSPAATDHDVAQTVSTIIAPKYKQLLTSHSTFRGVGVRILNQVPTMPMVAYTGDQGPGAQTDIDLPRQTCGIWFMQTNFAGRAYRGRSYMPFPYVTADAGDGSPTSTYLDNLLTLATNLMGITAVSVVGRTATLAWCIYHRNTKTSTDIVNWGTRAAWATQRRRGSFGRANVPPF